MQESWITYSAKYGLSEALKRMANDYHLTHFRPCFIGESVDSQIDRFLGLKYRITNGIGGEVTVASKDLHTEIQWMLDNGIEPSNIKIEVITGDNHATD